MEKIVFDLGGVKSKITEESYLWRKQIRGEELLLRITDAVVKKFSGGE